MYYPRLTIDLGKITHNSRLINDICRRNAIEVVGVTKGCLGSTQVAQAMLGGGIKKLGDSRILNLVELKKIANPKSLTLLRQPSKSQITQALELGATSLVTTLECIDWLAYGAQQLGKNHDVILMVEMGDQREGILPEKLLNIAKRAINKKSINLKGIGTNLSCFEDISPTPEQLEALVALAKEVEQKCSIELDVVSGGNSSVLSLARNDMIPKRINQLRIGEGILLGLETAEYQPIDGADQDAFVLNAEVAEVEQKGSCKVQVVIALGRADIDTGKLKPQENKLRVLKISSDHLALDASQCERKIRPGDIMSFIPSYFSLLAAMSSPYVNKQYIG